MDPKTFFKTPQSKSQKRYEALRAFYLEELAAPKVAKQFGYTKSSFYSLSRDFRKFLKEKAIPAEIFFIEHKSGPKPRYIESSTNSLITILRKKYLSVSDIKSVLDSQNIIVSESYIYNVLKKEGFARLPRRSKQAKKETMSNIPIDAPKTTLLTSSFENFSSSNVGIMCFVPYILKYDICGLISEVSYPGTKTIPSLNAILSFLALKLSNINRYSADDLWCMDRGLGFFAGLNVLPKAAWFSSYSHAVTRKMNIKFLRGLSKRWSQEGLLSDTANMDFVAIPYWGDDSSHFENNWSGTRHQALRSILAVLAHDPDSGIITYGDTDVRHDNESDVVIEFLDFYKTSGNTDIKCLVFDSKFTTYQNLRRLEDDDIKFITIRRRGKKIVNEIESLPKSAWKTVRVPASGNRTRQLKVVDQTVFLQRYEKNIRQIAITGHGKIKPAIIITNEFDMDIEQIIRKYCCRWLIEKAISEQTHFFHLNRISSSMVIKVDFDLTMTILAHNLYRLLAMDLPAYSHHTAAKMYEKFISNNGIVQVEENTATVTMAKKRHHPALLPLMQELPNCTVPWLGDRQLNFKAASHT